MDKPGLRDALPKPQSSDTRTDPFWSNLDSSLSAATVAPAQAGQSTAKRDLDVGLGDVARGVGAGALDLVGGIGELALQASNFGKESAGKQGGDYLEQARAKMANKLSPVLDMVAGAGDLATSGAELLTEGMSADAKEALGRRLVDETPEGRLTIGDGAGDIDVWAMKMAQGVGSLVPTLLAGGVTGVAAKASIGRAVTASMIKRGATQEVAEAVAAKTVSKLATGAAVATGAAGSVGSAGVNTRDSVLGMSFDELAQSDTFRQAFTRIDQDQQTQHLSDEEKLAKAREETANIASRATMSDAKTWGAAAMGSMMGDAMLFKMLAGKAAAGGVLKSAAKGAAGEGVGETLEEGVQQYAVNESINDVAAANIDPMKGVVSSALEGGLIGMGTGGALGGVGGLRGGKSQVESEGGTQVDPALAEEVAPIEQGEPVPADTVSAPVEPGLAPAVDTVAEPVMPIGEQNPLGPSASQFDEMRDVPAYLRRDDTADRFKGMAENSQTQEVLAGSPTPAVDDLLSQATPKQNEAIVEPVMAEQQLPPTEDVSEPPLAQSTELPALDAIVGQLQTLRITRRGKPFATEKEAAMASRKGQEMPVPLNGGGFGVAEIAEVEQAQAAATTQPSPPPLSYTGITDSIHPSDLSAASTTAETVPAQPASADDISQLAPAIDTGYREVIPTNQPQAEVSNEPVTPIPAIGSERQGDQPGTGEPAAAGAEPAITGLTEGAGAGDRADIAAPAFVPDGQQQDDQTLTAPAPDAGAAVSGRIGEVELRDRDLLKEHNGRWKYRSAVGAGWFTANTKEAAIERAEEAYRNGLAKGIPAPTRAERWAKEELEFAERMDGRFGKMTIPELEERHRKLGGAIADLQQAGRNEMDGNGGRRTGAAVASEGARQSGQEKMELERYIQLRRDRDTAESRAKSQQIEAARAEVELEPTEAQKEAGNYKKGHLTLLGLDVALENPKGSTRSGTDRDGKAWQSTMAHDYGYIKRSLGADGDHVDVFIGDHPESETVYVVDQADPKTGKFDEHKVMMGFADEQAAKAGYLANYERGWKGLSAIKAMPVEEFKRWVKEGDTKSPIAAQAVGGSAKSVSFSKQAMAQGNKPAKHLTRKEAELVSSGWFKQYRGASGIKVQIHATQGELESVLGLDAKEGLIRRAAFDDDAGTLHVAADTISDPKRMREILRHEVLAHYGLANVLGDGEYTKLMSRLIQSQKDPSMKPVWDWVNTHYADEDIGTRAEEVVAHLAELEQGIWGRGWDRVVAWVTRALRAVGFVPDGITAAETRSLIEGLGRKLQRNDPDDNGPDGGKRFSQEDAQAPTKKGGVKMSQAATTADKAMEKLNLGPKPDIIDKTKINLDKMRKVDRGVVESWVDRFIKKANTEVLDALAPIKYAEDAAGITDAADSGYVAARMATGAASTMQATMLYGLPEWKDGVIQRKAGTGEKDALLGIFSDLGADLHNWLGWMAGHRAELLMEQGRENLLSEQDIAALKELGKGKEAKFIEAKARWNRLNAVTLDLAQEAGLFTKEARDEFESEWYIPFFRESDDGDVIAPFKPKGIANQNAGIKKLKGGEANTNDLLENIFTSTSKLIDASMKNMAAQKTVWNLADTGLIEVVAKPNMMDWRALKNGKDLITVKLEGEDYMIRVEDPDLYRAMTFFDRQPFGSMVNMASKAKRLLTAGVTASPEFMLRNFLRDSLSSWAISKDGFKPVIDSIKGVKKTLAMEGSTIDVMFSGASFLGGYVNGNDPTAMADAVRKSLRRKGMTPEQIARYEKSIIRNAAQAKGVVANVWEKYNRFGEAFENGNREAVYDAAIKAGKSHAQAAFESKDLMDFSMLGAARAIQGAAMILPFFNARLQGLGKLTRELRDNPREIAKRAGMITAMSIGLLAANWDDERYEELPDWDKDANWHFFVGEQHFRIPKPFEIGVMFGTIPERMVRAMGDKDSGAQFGKAVARAIGDTFALNPTPQIVKPMVEAAFNYDSFRGGPIDSPQDLAVKAEARYNEQTSLLMRELGELSGFSPKQLEHLVIGYTGTMGSYVMAAADGLIRAARPDESASWRADEIPLVKAVYRGTGPAKSTQHMEEFYQMLNEVNQLKRTVDQYRSEGLPDRANELLDEQGGILKSRRSLSRTQQQVRVVRNRIELIQRDRTMNAEEKRRRIDELLARRNDLVYQAVNKNKANWE
ncbi:LPD38 domain-containing protein [Aeromonas hydrophila]|uniref:LPD38 domain-containing protein n=1 Tax=Aeromonas hydrophila TaxID=644 RepID=UPI0038D0E992